jgi:hypothetical protein
MKKKKRSRFNYRKVIKTAQSAPSKSVYPGMIMDFHYVKDNAFDPRPMVLVLWNDYKGRMIHGLNLNYLRRDQITDLVEKLVEGAKTYGDWGSHKKFETIFEDGKEKKIVQGEEFNKVVEETQRKLIKPKLKNLNEATSVKSGEEEKQYNNNLPYKNILKKPYTRIKLPTYKENRGGNPLSYSQAQRQMSLLYDKIVSKFITRGNQYQVYRSYKYNYMKEGRVLSINWEKLS